MRFIIGMIALVAQVVLAPIAQADPGPLDQYGGHECRQHCEESWDLGYGEYHYHVIQEEPQHYRGTTNKALMGFLEPVAAELTQPTTLLEPNTLIENPALDVSYCLDSAIFAHGLYDQEGKVRVPPVCEAFTPAALDTGYASLPADEGVVQRKAYVFGRDTQDRAHFTDRIPLAEIEGYMVQGITDPALYIVVPNGAEGGYALKYLGDQHVERMNTNTILFADSIIYSYPIKR